MIQLIWNTLWTKGFVTAALLTYLVVYVWLHGGTIAAEEVDESVL